MAVLLGLVAGGVIVVETAKFVQRDVAPVLAPLLGMLLGAAACIALLYFLFRVFSGPLQRLTQRVHDELDYRWELTRAEREIRRRIAAIQEEQRVRALAASARVHASAERAVVDGKLHLELEELKGRSERVVLLSQAAGAARTLARYQAAFRSLKEAQHLTPGEKARLVEEMRAILAESGPTRPARAEVSGADESEPSMSAEPPVVLEYRAPGGKAVPVTAEGFRRLVERDQLRPEDECRRMGSLAWTTVADVLADGSLR